MNLEELLTIAYNMTNIVPNGANIYMSTNYAKNQSLFKQEFRVQVIPINNKVPKQVEGKGTIVSSPVGYKELIVWVYFGDNTDWSGPELRWLYMDRAKRWDGEQISGGTDNIKKLKEISEMLRDEAIRISKIELEYLNKHGNWDGLVFEEYANID